MARRLLLRPGVGERLLTSKLQILTGAGNRRPSLALGMLTGRGLLTDDGATEDDGAQADRSLLAVHADHLSLVPAPPIDDLAELDEPATIAIRLLPRRRFAARTVYLSEPHLRAVEEIIDAWQKVGSRRLTRSAVLRRAIDHLRTAVDADPAKSMLENE